MIFEVGWGRYRKDDGTMYEGPMPRVGPFRLDSYSEQRLRELHEEDERRIRMFKKFARHNAPA